MGKDAAPMCGSLGVCKGGTHVATGGVGCGDSNLILLTFRLVLHG
jgi:hypothetical protein